MPPRPDASQGRIPADPRQDLVPPQKRRRDAMTGGGGEGDGDGEGGAQKKRRRVVDDEGANSASPFPRRPKSETALRIDVIRLVHRLSRSRRIRPPFNRPPPVSAQQAAAAASTTTAMCRITVSMKDGGRVMHCNGHKCTIETSKDPYGPHPLSRIQLDDPYSVDWGTLTGYEHIRRPPGTEDAEKRYKVTIEVESSASSTVWPPLKARDLVGVDKGLDPSEAYADGLCSHLLLDRPKGTPPPAAFECPHWRLESMFTGFSRPLSAPLLLKHFSSKGDLVSRTDYETRIMGGTA